MEFILQLALGFTVALASERAFAPGALVHWREAAPGVGMGLLSGAYVAAKCAVDACRLALLVAALLLAFYPLAAPRATFLQYYVVCAGAAAVASGWAYVFTVAQDAKTAQLSTVTALVAFAMFAGVVPSLRTLDEQQGAPGRAAAWASYGRWMIESLYTAETRSLSIAWRMPPTFYRDRGSSALAGLAATLYDEGATLLNVKLLLLYALGLRFVSYLALVALNRDRMGLVTPAQWLGGALTRAGERCACCARGAHRARGPLSDRQPSINDGSDTDALLKRRPSYGSTDAP